MTKQRKRKTVPSGTEKKLVGRRVSRMAKARETRNLMRMMTADDFGQFTGCQGDTAYDA
jgi:hypothetical protein